MKDFELDLEFMLYEYFQKEYDKGVKVDDIAYTLYSIVDDVYYEFTSDNNIEDE